MPNLNLRYLQKAWRYRIAEDFTSTDGTAASWAPGHPQEWGTAVERHVRPHSVAAASINADSALLAVSQAHWLHILSTADLSVQATLERSHDTGEVHAVAFRPHEPLKLVSGTEGSKTPGENSEPSISF